MFGSFRACVLSYIPMMPAHWRLSFCPDRRLTARSYCSPVCLTTVGIKADKSLSKGLRSAITLQLQVTFINVAK